MRPVLALNCLLQIEQERSEEDSPAGDALALVAFRCTRFCSASLIFFASYSPAPLLMRARHFARILCNLFQRFCWYIEVFKEGFEDVLVSCLLTTMGAFPTPQVLRPRAVRTVPMVISYLMRLRFGLCLLRNTTQKV